MTHIDDFQVVDKRRPLTTGRFQEVQSHWPLSGNESWKATVTSVPIADGGENRKLPFTASPEKWKRPFVMLWWYFPLEGGNAAGAAIGGDGLDFSIRPQPARGSVQIPGYGLCWAAGYRQTN